MLFAKLQKPLSLPDGTKIQDVTFGEAAAQLLKLRPEDPGAKLADFKVPALIDKTDKTIFAKPNQLGFVADLLKSPGCCSQHLKCVISADRIARSHSTTRR